MHIYPGQMYSPQEIKPRATEPDYTKAVSDIAQCTCTHSSDIIANRKTYVFKLQTDIWINVPNTSGRAHKPPPQNV